MKVIDLYYCMKFGRNRPNGNGTIDQTSLPQLCWTCTFRDRRGWSYAWGLPEGGGQTVRDIAKVSTETL
jgi:hypothetical protein